MKSYLERASFFEFDPNSTRNGNFLAILFMDGPESMNLPSSTTSTFFPSVIAHLTSTVSHSATRISPAVAMNKKFVNPIRKIHTKYFPLRWGLNCKSLPP